MGRRASAVHVLKGDTLNDPSRAIMSEQVLVHLVGRPKVPDNILSRLFRYKNSAVESDERSFHIPSRVFLMVFILA